MMKIISIGLLLTILMISAVSALSPGPEVVCCNRAKNIGGNSNAFFAAECPELKLSSERCSQIIEDWAGVEQEYLDMQLGKTDTSILPSKPDVVCCWEAWDREENINETHLATEKCSEFGLDTKKCLEIIGTGYTKDYIDVTYGEYPCSSKTECQEFCESNNVNEADCFGILQKWVCDPNDIDETECFGIMQKWVREEPAEENDTIQTILLIAAALAVIWSVYKFVHIIKKKE